MLTLEKLQEALGEFAHELASAMDAAAEAARTENADGMMRALHTAKTAADDLAAKL